MFLLTSYSSCDCFGNENSLDIGCSFRRNSIPELLEESEKAWVLSTTF